MSAVVSFANLQVGCFRFTVVPCEDLQVPALNKGNMLRGGFGHAFRKLCCIPQCEDSKTCPLAATCPYKTIFEPSPPPGAERLSKNQDIPRPFVFRAARSVQTCFPKGEPFKFALVLIGRALEYLPYFVLSFRELARQGVGMNRARSDLQVVEQIKISNNGSERGSGNVEPIFSSEDQLFRTAETITADEWVRARLRDMTGPKDGKTRRLKIRFLTPTFLRANGEVVRRPEFHHVFKRLRDRINALATFFGEGPLDVDFRGIGERAEKVRTVSAQIDWVERFRTSSKTRQRHELSGFVGEATYEGELTEFLPWLTLGELVHVGKHTAWGNGWIQLT
ncbi:MAG: CRISPR system precrRNA processing endoribonuclease RAMP protein Cas6 [Acidobacteria bacterium]|nr:CRISPR system precrRNA processing endoribonuclease RAMP protein Cas6 [Acidobacteriota bacterium]